MDTPSFINILDDSPHATLLDAVRGRQDRFTVLPLLEAELHRSSLRLQRLKEHRNILASPMYSLHPEILAQILTVAARDNDELFDLRWTRFMLVCRRWHNVAKDIRSLWSSIELNVGRPYPRRGSPNMIDGDDLDVRRVESQRFRAGLSPLTVRLRLHGVVPPAKLPYARMFWIPSRLASLDVSADTAHLDGVVSSMAPHEHTLLQDLTMTCLQTRRDIAGTREIEEVLSRLLSDKLPRLRHLSIAGILFHPSSLRGGLRSLRIRVYATIPMDLQDLLSALSRCPELEVLSLSLPKGLRDESTPTSITVPMVHLQDIAVECPVQICIIIFQTLISIPAAARIAVAAGLVEEIAPILELAAYLRDHAARENAPAIRSVAMTKFPSLRDFPDLALDGGVPPPPPPAISRFQVGIVAHQRSNAREARALHHPLAHQDARYIGLDAQVSPSLEREYMGGVLQLWPLSRATHLDLRFTQIFRENVAMFLANLPALTTVILRPESTDSLAFITTLRAQLQGDGRRAVAHIIFDAQELDRHYSRPSFHMSHTTTPRVLARRTLIRVLCYCKAASRAGVPLDTVEIVNEPQEGSQSLVHGVPGEVNWEELYQDLEIGFVYGGILHSARRELDGMKWDFFKHAVYAE
ncbi:unnamed protein product [Peniophora sp. CBMAI 1063]|nr:unnamed protein product [Peniophora sp. CBMAI 1063]